MAGGDEVRIRVPLPALRQVLKYRKKELVATGVSYGGILIADPTGHMGDLAGRPAQLAAALALFPDDYAEVDRRGLEVPGE